MPNQDEPSAQQATNVPTPDDDIMSSSAVVVPGSDDGVNSTEKNIPDDVDVYTEVSRKISDAHNVLIALSSDPSVDEMAAAIGLSLYLDRLGKHTTAIYSGSTPNALEFLNPEETFETTADTLQDFVIAINKEKADHLRYKLDGEYVKIYITPYKKRISEEDLEFSYGDFNVDLVLALDISNGIDLDAALREHGRIMHNAVIINVTTGNPGKFGEIEWSDKAASSVSEMLAKLLYSVNSKIKIEKEEAMAFLTGIVAATNRFAGSNVTSDTMKVVSRLIESGANPQLVAKNITDEIENEFYSSSGSLSERSKRSDDKTNLDIDHNDEIDADETKIVDGDITEKESTLLDDLKKAEANLAQAGAETIVSDDNEPIKIETDESAKITEADTTPTSVPKTEDELKNVAEETDKNSFIMEKPEKVIQPFASMDLNDTGVEAGKYGKMLEDALNEADTNPATSAAPVVNEAPEINGVPEINYMPMPDGDLLPPPPAPPINFDEPNIPDYTETPIAVDSNPVTMPAPSSPAIPEPAVVTPDIQNQPIQEPSVVNPVMPEPIAAALPPVEPTPEPLGEQPAMQDQVYNPQASDPAAFKIPGM